MNERIKELAIEWADQLDWDFPSDPKEYTFSSIALEKFAKLIIKECANICFSEAQGHNMAFGEHCGVVIKEHFGVE